MKKVLLFAAIAASAMMVYSCKCCSNSQEGEGAEACECCEQAEGACQGAAAVCDKCFEGIEELDGIDAAAAAAAVDGLAEELQAKGVLPYAAVEVKPQFNGGEANNFQKYVQENIKYPQTAIENNEEGKVLVNFNVDKDGKVCDVKVLKGASEALDAEAVRVISEAPAWTPGAQAGNNVAVNYTMPVVFALK